MIFDLFLSFIGLSLILVFLGYYTKPSIKILAVLGFATIFFLGGLLQFGGISLRTGSTDIYVYSNSSISNVTTVYSYATINDAVSVWVGRWLSIVSALAVALVFASNKDDEE